MILNPKAIPADRVLRTLVVDDHVDTASALATLIEEWGFRARAANNGAGAVEAFVEFRPMVALIDLNLGGENGYEIAAQLRERAWRRRLYMMVITGNIEVADQVLSTRTGISHHLIKPVNPDVLRRILSTYQFAEEVIARPPQPDEVAPPRRGSM